MLQRRAHEMNNSNMQGAKLSNLMDANYLAAFESDSARENIPIQEPTARHKNSTSARNETQSPAKHDASQKATEASSTSHKDTPDDQQKEEQTMAASSSSTREEPHVESTSSEQTRGGDGTKGSKKRPQTFSMTNYTPQKPAHDPTSNESKLPAREGRGKNRKNPDFVTYGDAGAGKE